MNFEGDGRAFSQSAYAVGKASIDGHQPVSEDGFPRNNGASTQRHQHSSAAVAHTAPYVFDNTKDPRSWTDAGPEALVLLELSKPAAGIWAAPPLTRIVWTVCVAPFLPRVHIHREMDLQPVLREFYAFKYVSECPYSFLFPPSLVISTDTPRSIQTASCLHATPWAGEYSCPRPGYGYRATIGRWRHCRREGRSGSLKFHFNFILHSLNVFSFLLHRHSRIIQGITEIT